MREEPAEDADSLGRRLVERGLVSPEQIAECIREQSELRSLGVVMRLGQILLRRRLISTAQLVSILREPGVRPSPAAGTEGGVRKNRYEILEEAGRGGVGVVYRAHDRELDRLVALKILKEELLLHPKAVERFHREAAAASRLSHPNIVSVHDYGEEGGRPFIVMELVEGGTLSDLLSERTIERNGLLEILRKVAEAAECAHAHGIVHRDLKPGNILIDPAGEPRLVDFGLAHLAGAELALTRQGAQLGTPLYMAPEQVQGDPDKIDPRTDVYALGAILYETLTGRVPHIGDSVPEVYRRILTDDPAPPRTLRRDLPRDLEAICLTALNRERERRYPSARALADDLGAFLRGEPVRARSPSLARRIRGAARRRPVAAVLLLATLVVLAGLTAWQAVDRFQRERTVRDLTVRARDAMARSRWSEARELLGRALQIDPGSREAAKLRDGCLREIEREREGFVRALTAGSKLEVILQDRESREANLERIDRMIEEVERELDDLTRTSPGLAVAWHQKGRLQALRWRFPEAQEAYDRALALDPDSALTRLERSESVLLQWALAESPHLPAPAHRKRKQDLLGRPGEDFRLLISRRRELPSRARRTAEVLEAVLMLETTSDAAELAIESLEDSHRRHRDASFLVWMGLLRHQIGDAAGAGKALKEAVEERPYSLLGRVALARTFQSLGELEPALQQWEFALQIDPGNRFAIRGKAACLEAAGKFDAALETLGEDASPVGRMARGRALAGLSRWEEARREFSSVLDAEPDAALARVERARVLAALRQFRAAIDDLERASEQDAEVREKVAVLLEEYRRSM